MGTYLKANCPCGYATNVTAGNSRADIGKKYFHPYRCRHCRTVVDIEIMGSTITCPTCSSTDVFPYGVDTARCGDRLGQFLGPKLRKFFGRHLPHEEIAVTYSIKSPTHKSLMYIGNTCPKCEQESLVFDVELLIT
jgi:hypothetical protein